MKELTIEQKAKAYDEALERMKSWVKGVHPECFTEAQKVAEFIFPELKESEDEIIRKDIIRVLKGEISFVSEKENEKYIAWLEKQGEDEKVDEQNCVNPTNNPEPKFCEGDCVVTDKGVTIQIATVNPGYYILDDGMEFSKSYVDKYWHLWTIQDAKAGDVLFGRYGTFIFMGKGCGYCGVLSDNTFISNTGNNEWTEDLCPATKNQRDLLFKKMHKAGYEWDADKNEPKIIDWSKFIKYNPNATSTAEEKSTWTETDEKIRKEIISALKFLETELKWDFIEDDEIDISDVYNWLEKQSNKV